MNRLGIDPTRAVKPLMVTLANGVELVASRVAKLAITFPGPESLCHECVCYVVPELHQPLILGYAWLV